MVRVSDRPILFDREALIAALQGDERIAALRDALNESEEEWGKRAAHTLMHSTKPVDQRKIDFMRGYFAGAQHWLGGRIDLVAQTRLTESLEPKEDDA